MAFLGALASVQERSVLQNLELHQIIMFLNLSAKLKNDILLAQPSRLPATQTPDVLPPIVAEFLGDALGFPPEDIDKCWDMLKDDVWRMPDSTQITPEEENMFRIHGWKRGISK